MMKFNRIISILSIACLVPVLDPSGSIDARPNPSPTAIAQATDDLPTPDVVKKTAKDITVRITSANNGGSGVLVAKKGTTYLVLTNRHVAGKDSQLQIQTPDGQKHTATPVKNTGINPKYDVALLQFTSTKQYQLAKFKYSQNEGSSGSVSPLNLTRTIYSAGFPFDSKELRFSMGEVSQLSDVPLDDGTQIGYKMNQGQKELRQGMSGGPIIDVGGLVIGINAVGSNPILPSYTYFDGSQPTTQTAANYQQANWGVPIYNFLTQLDANILYNYDNFPKVQRQVTPTGYMAKLNRETRQQTVRIEDSAGNGSGVIVAKQGNTYYVLTAKHVLETPPNEEKKIPKQLHAGIKVITYDQQSFQIEPSEIKLAEGLDLAVVKFTSQTNYPVAKLGNYSPDSSASVFVAGYPGREKIDSPLWQWQLNYGYLTDKETGKFTIQDKQSFTHGYDLIYTSISYGGMSGGPIIDTDGRVIGIHGRAEQTDGSLLGESLGVSIQTFIRVINQLKVPNILQVSNSPVAALSKLDLGTVLITLPIKIDKPQDESNGELWLQYGNQLYRAYNYSKAALAFEKAIAKGQTYTLRGNYGKALSLIHIDNYQASKSIHNAILAVPFDRIRQYYYLWKYQSFIYYLSRKYDDALRSIDEAIKMEPNDLILLDRKAIILSLKQQYKETILIYDLLISKQPEAYAYSRRGSAKFALGKNQEAINDYDLAITIDPDYADAYFERGNAKSAMGQNQAAIGDYNRAITINPSFIDVYIKRGNAKLSIGQTQAAMIDYDLAITKSNIISIVPNSYAARSYIARGNAKYKLGNKQAAIADYNLAISNNPNSANAYNIRGSVLFETEQKQAAIADYDRAIAINQNFANAYYNRGNAKSELGQKQAAIADYDRAIAINQNFANAYYNRGNAKSELGQKQAAIADYDRAIAINPNYSKAYHNRGVAKSALGQKQAAITDYDRAIVINPSFTQCYYNRGNTKYELGQEQAAIIDYDLAIAISPKENYIYVSRGWSRFLINNITGALKDWEQAIQLKQNAAAYNNRGFYKIMMGDLRGGLVDIEQAIKLDPKLSDSYAIRGLIREISGDTTGATFDYKQALKINPEIINEWIKNAKVMQKHNNRAAYQKYQQIIQKLKAQS